MLNLFKRKSQKDKLQAKYEKHMSNWHKLSTINRSESDKEYAKAQDILNQINALD